MRWIIESFLAHPAWSGIGGIVGVAALLLAFYSSDQLTIVQEKPDITDEVYSAKPFDGRVGKIFIKNTSLYEFKVTLWHPDSEKIFNSWVIGGTSKKYLKSNNQAISIGNDWGIQIGNSKVKAVYEASDWMSGEWRVSQDTFFK